VYSNFKIQFITSVRLPAPAGYKRQKGFTQNTSIYCSPNLWKPEWMSLKAQIE